MAHKIHYNSFDAPGTPDDAEFLKHKEEIRRKLTEALLSSHVNTRCAFVPAMHPVERMLNRKRKQHAEVIEVVARKVERP